MKYFGFISLTRSVSVDSSALSTSSENLEKSGKTSEHISEQFSKGGDLQNSFDKSNQRQISNDKGHQESRGRSVKFIIKRPRLESSAKIFTEKFQSNFQNLSDIEGNPVNNNQCNNLKSDNSGSCQNQKLLEKRTGQKLNLETFSVTKRRIKPDEKTLNEKIFANFKNLPQIVQNLTDEDIKKKQNDSKKLTEQIICYPNPCGPSQSKYPNCPEYSFVQKYKSGFESEIDDVKSQSFKHGSKTGKHWPKSQKLPQDADLDSDLDSEHNVDSMNPEQYTVELLKYQPFSKVIKFGKIIGPYIARINCNKNLSGVKLSLLEKFVQCSSKVSVYSENRIILTLKPNYVQEFKLSDLNIGVAEPAR